MTNPQQAQAPPSNSLDSSALPTREQAAIDDDDDEDAVNSSGRKEPNRNFRVSTRENAAFKWKHDKSVVGALEVKSSPKLDPKSKLKEHSIVTTTDEYQTCLRIWHKEHLQRSFIEAIEGIPPQMGCCGLIYDPNATIQNVAHLLNQGWAAKINKEYFESAGYKLSLFVWTWSNVGGAAQNVVLLIRFHSLKSVRK